jgi:acyl carrier protein
MGWAIFALLAALSVLFAWFHPDERRERQYKSLLVSREPVTDGQLTQQFFNAGEIASEIPGAIRSIFAKHMSYPAVKMLPDDDLNFYWNEIDMVDLVREVESRFGIFISDLDAKHCRCTIRSVSMLVESKCATRRYSS